MGVPYDIRFRTYSECGDLSREIDFVRAHYKTDIIFIIYEEENTKLINKNIFFDLRVSISKNSAIIKYENKDLMVTYQDLPEALCRILS